MRIHLLCDQKWRDLPNLSVLKLELERLGHRVLLSATKDAEPMMKAFRPDCVVFNHLFGERHQRMAAALRASGVSVVLLPTEGATHPKSLSLLAGGTTDYRVADLLLPWSTTIAELIRERWGFSEQITPVVGCTRFDFYDGPLVGAVMSRDEFCRRYDFDPMKPIITWASQYVFAHLEKPSAQRDKFLSDARDFGLDTFFAQQDMETAEVPRIHAEAQRAALDAVLKLAQALPDAQFVLRPHPAEDRNFYRVAIAREGLTNMRFCPQDYIWNILRATDVHLHRHCTTAVEAWNWDKPTVEMAMNSRYAAWPEREECSDVADDAESLIAIVKDHLEGGGTDTSRRQRRRAYIDRWFGDLRGARCHRAAQEIDSFLRRTGRRRSLKTPLRGISGSPRQVVTAVARYALGLRPNESLLRRGAVEALDPKDKQITRHDVRDYGRLVASALGRGRSGAPGPQVQAGAST